MASLVAGPSGRRLQRRAASALEAAGGVARALPIPLLGPACRLLARALRERGDRQMREALERLLSCMAPSCAAQALVADVARVLAVAQAGRPGGRLAPRDADAAAKDTTSEKQKTKEKLPWWRRLTGASRASASGRDDAASAAAAAELGMPDDVRELVEAHAAALLGAMMSSARGSLDAGSARVLCESVLPARELDEAASVSFAAAAAAGVAAALPPSSAGGIKNVDAEAKSALESSAAAQAAAMAAELEAMKRELREAKAREAHRDREREEEKRRLDEEREELARRHAELERTAREVSELKSKMSKLESRHAGSRDDQDDDSVVAGGGGAGAQAQLLASRQRSKKNAKNGDASSDAAAEIEQLRARLEMLERREHLQSEHLNVVSQTVAQHAEHLAPHMRGGEESEEGDGE